MSWIDRIRSNFKKSSIEYHLKSEYNIEIEPDSPDIGQARTEEEAEEMREIDREKWRKYGSSWTAIHSGEVVPEVAECVRFEDAIVSINIK